MDFGDDPNFVLSVGGFHPRFTPPPLPFPTPNRLALDIINESYARVRVEAYFAVTTEHACSSARAPRLFFGFDALSVEGHFGFDALFRFSPFYFIVEISAGFSVKVFGLGVLGVHLRGSLEGPTPWHITGPGLDRAPVLLHRRRRRRHLRRAPRATTLPPIAGAAAAAQGAREARELAGRAARRRPACW